MRSLSIPRLVGRIIYKSALRCLSGFGFYILTFPTPLLAEIHIDSIQSGEQIEIQWSDRSPNVGPQNVNKLYEVQTSHDLQGWAPGGRRIERKSVPAGDRFSITLPITSNAEFFRILCITKSPLTKLGHGGAEIFGYESIFQMNLENLGQISLDAFADRYKVDAPYLPEIETDPTQAAYWDRFNTNPNENNRRDRETGRPALEFNDPEYRDTDFRLNESELEVFMKNGFVVSERLGSGSFADIYYKLWKDDMPVFISSDSILQAWHRSYDLLLVELEEKVLLPALDQLFETMAEGSLSLLSEATSPVMQLAVKDADYFLAVARTLLLNRTITGPLDQKKRVADTRRQIQGEKLETVSDLFGQCRKVDFSQFKPRGHYLRTEQLGRYFQAMMWCGRIDLRVAGGPFDDGCGPRMASPRELGTAIALWDLIKRAGLLDKWDALNTIIETFVGPTDSMTFRHLDSLMAQAGIQSASDIKDEATLMDLQQRIVDGHLGIQHIRSDFFYSPLGSDQIQLPRSFTVFGQKFIPDSWALSKLVYDDILWDNIKVGRRVPSAIDVAFSVLRNDQTVPLLSSRISNSEGHPFRDGFPIQHNLAAVRDTLDSQDSAVWSQNIYSSWLYTLRALSDPTTGKGYPDALQTRAWAMKTLNTQLASWTHLRHDTILYAKQSYTGVPLCFFPTGYVETRPQFWQRLGDMAQLTSSLMGTLEYPDTYNLRHAEFLAHFSTTCDRLHHLASKELEKEPFNEEDQLFVRNLIEDVGWSSFGSAQIRAYDGWYPRLFYRPHAQRDDSSFNGLDGADKQDAVVADIHTDPPCGLCSDPGSVLHQGVGFVNLLMMTVDAGEGPTTFAGPVLSHYEFEIPGAPQRLNDFDWEQVLWGWDHPFGFSHSPPEWTADYLVPRKAATHGP
jgi:hypothetical protein